MSRPRHSVGLAVLVVLPNPSGRAVRLAPRHIGSASTTAARRFKPGPVLEAPGNGMPEAMEAEPVAFHAEHLEPLAE